MSTDATVCPECEGSGKRVVWTDDNHTSTNTIGCWRCGGTGKKSDLLYK